MGNVRALIASIGTGALLVAAVVASLVSISFVFAVGGFDGAQAADSRQALTLDLPQRSRSAARSALVVRPPERSERRRRAARSSVRPRIARSGATTASSSITSTTSTPRTIPPGDGGPQGGIDPTPAPPDASSAARKPNLGDGVKKLGEDLSSSLEQTGSDLAEATAPLGPTVSAAVQQVLNIVAALVRHTTNVVGGVLGAKSGP